MPNDFERDETHERRLAALRRRPDAWDRLSPAARAEAEAYATAKIAHRNRTTPPEPADPPELWRAGLRWTARKL